MLALVCERQLSVWVRSCEEGARVRGCAEGCVKDVIARIAQRSRDLHARHYCTCPLACIVNF